MDVKNHWHSFDTWIAAFILALTFSFEASARISSSSCSSPSFKRRHPGLCGTTVTCAYQAGTGISSPTGNVVGSTVSGYTSKTAVYPKLCGSSVTRTCQSTGTWSGTTPLYVSCQQQCLNPDTNLTVNSGSTYSYYTISSGTQSECDAAKRSSTCSASTGQLAPTVASTRFASCAVVTPPPVVVEPPPVVTPPPVSTDPTLSSADFATRCSQPGVVKCVSFDQASDIAGGFGDISGVLPGSNNAPTLDSANKAYTWYDELIISSRDIPDPSASNNNPGPVINIDLSAPSVPSGVKATVASTSQINLSWSPSTDNVGVAQYQVFLNGTMKTSTSSLNYSFTNLNANTNYSMSVRAVDAAGNTSAQSMVVSASTLSVPTPPPTTPPPTTTTSLSQLAASMTSGSWANFTMGGLDGNLMAAAGQSVPSFSLYAARGFWDAVHKKIQFAGTSHTGGAYFPGAGALITWDAATNQWTKESYNWSSEDPGHSYFHLSLHGPTGDLYYRSFNSRRVYHRAYGTNGQASWVLGHIADVPSAANQVAGALEWFPELNNGAGGFVFVDQVGAAYSNSAFSSWTQTSTTLLGPYHNWSAHAGGAVYYGGGNGSTAMYRLSAGGAVTKLPDTPYEAGNNLNVSVVFPHPNGNELLIFQTVVGGAIQKFNGTSWSTVGTHQIGGTHWIGIPIPEYGVIVFIIHPGGTGTPYARVYKP